MRQKVSTSAPAATTVLIPTFNRASLIGQSIDSVLNQTRPPAQVIVIDDGSDDATGEVVSTYGDKVRYLRQENAGKSSALNLGLTHVETSFVWIFDDDDIAAPDALQRLLQVLEQSPDAGYSYGRCDKFHGDWPATERTLNYAFHGDSREALYVKLMEDFFLWQGAMLVRKEVYDAVGPFDQRFSRSQDYEMALRIARRFDGVAVPFVAFHQRHHSGVRGTRAAPVQAALIEETWRRYNHLLFREIHSSHDLEEFYIPSDEPEEGDRRVVVCLIQRASIMARKGLWTSRRPTTQPLRRSRRAAHIGRSCFRKLCHCARSSSRAPAPSSTRERRPCRSPRPSRDFRGKCAWRSSPT